MENQRNLGGIFIMIKILFVCHSRTNDYCSVIEILGQIKDFAVPSHYGKTTTDGSKINKCSSQKQLSSFI